MIYILGTHVGVQGKNQKKNIKKSNKNNSKIDFYEGVNFNFDTKLSVYVSFQLYKIIPQNPV